MLMSLSSAGVIIFGKRKQPMDATLLSALVIVVLLHGIIDHFRLQMVPTYVVTLGLIIVLILRLIKSQNKARLQSRLKKGLVSIVVMAITAVSIYLTNLLPLFSMPDPTGKYAIGTISQHLTDITSDETLTTDQGDKRELMVNVWYPVDPETAKRKPKENYPAELGEAISLVFGLSPTLNRSFCCFGSLRKQLYTYQVLLRYSVMLYIIINKSFQINSEKKFMKFFSKNMTPHNI
jgi:hypothetical protein